MNVISKLVNRIRKKKEVAERETRELNFLLDWLGISNVKKSARSEATYFACLRVLSEAIGKLPLKLMQRMPNNGVRTAHEHPLFSIVNSRPNPFMTATSFWSTIEQNRDHHGNGYALITGFGSSTRLWILEGNKVEIINDDKDLFGNGANKIYYSYSGANGLYVFSNEEVLHLKTSCTLDGYTGASVRQQLKSTITGNVKAQAMLNRLYDNGYTGKMVLQYTGDLSDDNVERLRKGLERYARSEGIDGEEDNRSIIPIPLGQQLTPLNIKLTDGDFLNVKKYSAIQIAAAFGLKPNQIGDYEKSSYANAEAQQLDFYVDTLLYIVKQYEEELTYKLLSEEEIANGYFFKFNISVILRADLETQIKTLSNAVSNFIYTPNEARAKLDLEAKEGGDQLLGNGAAIPVQLTGVQYTNKLPAQSGAAMTAEGDGTIDASDDIENINADRVLNGTQTTALIDVVEAYQEGRITYNQAANIISVAIGITLDEAKVLLGPPNEQPENAPAETPEEVPDNKS